MIIKEDILTDSEIKFLDNVSKNFKPTSTPLVNKHYYKQTIEDYSELKNFIEKSKLELLKLKKNISEVLCVEEVWLNKVTPETNTNDIFHKDIDELTSITFLNDDFVGGELQIQKDGILNIKPKKGNTLFFNGAHTAHRVLPVTNGVRYTLVVFWSFKSKKSKSLF